LAFEPSIVVLGGNWGNALEVSSLADTLLSSGKTVVLIMPLLDIGFDLPQRWIENQVRAGKAIDGSVGASEPSSALIRWRGGVRPEREGTITARVRPARKQSPTTLFEK
jgi:hypothetical protein